MPAALDAAILLAYVEEETARWKQWFAAHPEALAAPCDIARVETLGKLLYHTMWVEKMYACRLLNLPIPELNQDAEHTVASLFAMSEEAAPLFRQFLDSATAESMAEILTWQSRFSGELKFSRNKILFHALLHSIRHWAQVPPVLRAAGFDTVIKDANGKTWMHDFIFSGVME